MKKLTLFVAFAAVAFGQSARSDKQALTDKGTRLSKRTNSQAANALGGGGLTNVVVQEITRRPVTWTLDAATCALVKSKITATGQGKTSITVLQNEDGTLNYETLDEVSGTAKDDKGGEYIFLYRINQLVEKGNTFPEPILPFVFTGPDYFQLIPTNAKAATAGYIVNIFFNGKVNADGSFTDIATSADNDPNCDPI